MPKSETWPGGVAMQSSSNLDSAGSCDSVISMNSGYSQDSMEHLSPEERACLMYLEETIEALEVQEDSGFSNDEPDPPFQAGRGVNDVSSLEPGSRGFFIEDPAELHALNQASEPPMNLMTQPNPPVTESAADVKVQPSASELCVSKNRDGQLQIIPLASLCPGPSIAASEIDVIPPPSDFMDEPGLPPHRPNVKYLSPSARLSNDNPGAAVDLERLRQRAIGKKTAVNSFVTQNHPNQPRKLSLRTLSSDLLTSPPPGEPEEIGPRSPPIVAPKPKKLPANIILKSHKGAMAISDEHLEHSMPTSSDRLSLDHQRVRNEALRKLGLLPPDVDSGLALSPTLSPKSRMSWAAPLSPNSPKAALSVSYASVNSSSPGWASFQSPAAVSPPATSTAPAVQPAEVLPAPAEVLPAPAEVLPAPAKVLPAPAAFSDSDGPPLSNNKLSAVEAALKATQVSTPPRTPPSQVKHLIPPQVVGIKSATLERSGVGLSNFIAQQDSTEVATASQIHKSRPRPASLGSRKEFTSAGREASPLGRATSRQPEVRRSLPAHPGDSKKLPRSQGISVLICPRSENGGERREALKKLGLLRD